MSSLIKVDNEYKNWIIEISNPFRLQILNICAIFMRCIRQA